MPNGIAKNNITILRNDDKVQAISYINSKNESFLMVNFISNNNNLFTTK
jgi:hypothetical protein